MVLVRASARCLDFSTGRICMVDPSMISTPRQLRNPCNLQRKACCAALGKGSAETRSCRGRQQTCYILRKAVVLPRKLPMIAPTKEGRHCITDRSPCSCRVPCLCAWPRSLLGYSAATTTTAHGSCRCVRPPSQSMPSARRRPPCCRGCRMRQRAMACSTGRASGTQ